MASGIEANHSIGQSRGRKKRMQMTKPTIIKISMVKNLINELIHRKIQWKSILFRKEVFLAQSSRKPVNLNEYIPKKVRRLKNIFVICYHVDEEKTLIEHVMKESHDNSSNLFRDVCTTKISFNDEDLLLRLKPYNQPFLLKDMSMKR
jgi:hypothetical protein